MNIPIIDLFAGPGGLHEGFAALRDASGNSVFGTAASFEMDSAACSTLALRGAFRRLTTHSSLSAYGAILRGELLAPSGTHKAALEETYGPEFAGAWLASASKVHKVELGSDGDDSSRIIRKALNAASIPRKGGRWVLIGGPPCQAYSLAGRSRRANDLAFEEDKKHFLYREYLRILAQFQPAVFVMENVKGLLSSTHSGEGMFAQIRGDLARPGAGVRYSLYSLTVEASAGDLNPEDFVIRCEAYGVPQKRHRVIILGLRQPDFDLPEFPRLEPSHGASVRQVIGTMPVIRSRVSRTSDSPATWSAIRGRAMAQTRGWQGNVDNLVSRSLQDIPPLGSLWNAGNAGIRGDRKLTAWIKGTGSRGLSQHEARSHMAEDLVRYYFAANFALDTGRSPSLADFDHANLLPNHASAHSERRPFSDRFRVQLWDSPSTTIVSHIAKDGHYYIHPDPMQMRSLTVREAARLQTFPDNYFFVGNRTQQYVQVGNAVPPFLANQIASIVQWIFDTELTRRHC